MFVLLVALYKIHKQLYLIKDVRCLLTVKFSLKICRPCNEYNFDCERKKTGNVP